MILIPCQYNNTIYDCFNIRVIVDRERTGFEESKDFRIVINSLIAGRYQVMEYLGSAQFSKAIKVSIILLRIPQFLLLVPRYSRKQTSLS